MVTAIVNPMRSNGVCTCGGNGTAITQLYRITIGWGSASDHQPAKELRIRYRSLSTTKAFTSYRSTSLSITVDAHTINALVSPSHFQRNFMAQHTDLT